MTSGESGTRRDRPTIVPERLRPSWGIRLPNGSDVDLTEDQFHHWEAAVGAQVQQRPPGPPGRYRQEYELLLRRVLPAVDRSTGPCAEDDERLRRPVGRLEQFDGV
ncbi:YunG family protein [Micromonospora sp. LA-10]|uniref:YunG family protein n=1 Tax=Micromonospora sp. LA-10 TaxID=3446364 RepID=UPI003F713F66